MNAKKETGLIQYEPEELLAAEQKVHEAEQEFAESFYHIGKALEPIRENELWRLLPDCRGWKHYCQLGRLDYRYSQADLYIKAAGVRPLLVDLPEVKGSARADTWNLKVVEQLCRLPLDSDIKRASKKIASRVKKGDRLSRSLAKEIVDSELGVSTATRKKKAKQLAAASTPAQALTQLAEWVEDQMTSLADMEATFWTDAEEESPGIVKRLTRALSSFVSFLKE